MIIWLTGISGAGKTTIAKSIYDLLKPKLNSLIFIDGDVVREIFGNDLGFNEEDRKIQIQRIQKISLLLYSQNLNVIVAALYSEKNLLKWNRENFSNYFEVYINTPMSIVEKRDNKSLYKNAKKGKINNIVGIDIPWNAPENSDLVVSSHHKLPNVIAKEIIRSIPKFSDIITS